MKLTSLKAFFVSLDMLNNLKIFLICTGLRVYSILHFKVLNLLSKGYNCKSSSGILLLLLLFLFSLNTIHFLPWSKKPYQTALTTNPPAMEAHGRHPAFQL